MKVLFRLSVFCLCCVVEATDLPAQDVPITELGSNPEVVIGTVDGSRAYTFQFLVDAIRLSDGQYLAADLSMGEVRLFDQEGQFLISFGGRGQGPSEFQYIDGIELAGETLIVFDPRSNKIALFNLDGTLVSTERPPRSASLIGIDSEGHRWWAWTAGQAPGPQLDIQTDRILIGVSQPSAEELEEVAEVGTLWRVGSGPYPFSPVTQPILYRDSLLIADAVRGELKLLDREGRVGRIIQVPTEPTDVSQAWEVLRNELEAREQQELLSRSEALPRVRSLPRIAAVLADDQHRLWIKEYDPAEDAHWLGGWAGGEGGSWVVLNPKGDLVGRVRLTARIVPLRIQDGFLLGRYRDEWDVQYLVVHRLPSFGH